MESRSKTRKMKKVEVEESSAKIFRFTDLIEELKFKVFDYLPFEHLSLVRQASKGWKNAIDNYVKLRQRRILRLPPDIEYTDENIQHLEQNIGKALRFLGQQPNQCLLPVDCKIFYSRTVQDIKASPPLEALEAINKSGVKISLNIMFNFQYDPDEETILESYMFMLNQIFINLSNMECLKIGPAPYQNLTLEPYWSRQIFNKIQDVAHRLNSLSICKMDVYSDDLISCLDEITQLSSFSMSEVVIYHTEFFNTDVSGLGRDFCEVLKRKPLTKLKLSHSSISILDDIGYTNIYPIVRLLPHLTPEILLKLKTLDLSNNKLLESFCYIDLSETVHPILYESLANLEELNLVGNDIDQDCMGRLFPFIDGLKKLSKLNLSFNKIPVMTVQTVKDLLLPKGVTLILNNYSITGELESDELESDELEQAELESDEYDFDEHDFDEYDFDEHKSDESDKVSDYDDDVI